MKSLLARPLPQIRHWLEGCKNASNFVLVKSYVHWNWKYFAWLKARHSILSLHDSYMRGPSSIRRLSLASKRGKLVFGNYAPKNQIMHRWCITCWAHLVYHIWEAKYNYRPFSCVMWPLRNLSCVITTQCIWIHDPPCWCTGFTEINHVMKKVYTILCRSHRRQYCTCMWSRRNIYTLLWSGILMFSVNAGDHD